MIIIFVTTLSCRNNYTEYPKCSECPECACEECSDCFHNPLAGEYFFHSMTINTSQYGPLVFLSSADDRLTSLVGNASMKQNKSISHDFYMHFLFATKSDVALTEGSVEGEIHFSGEYFFDSRNLFVVDRDGNFMKFLYDISNISGIDYLYLLPYSFDENDEGDILDIILQRMGNYNECGLVGESFGHCYEDSYCENEFENGCYEKESCYFLGGVGWRRCELSADDSSHENDGYCELNFI